MYDIERAELQIRPHGIAVLLKVTSTTETAPIEIHVVESETGLKVLNKTYELGTEVGYTTILDPGNYNVYLVRTSDGLTRELQSIDVPRGQYIDHTVDLNEGGTIVLGGHAVITQPGGLEEAFFQTSLYDFNPTLTPVATKKWKFGDKWSQSIWTGLAPNTTYVGAVLHKDVWYPTIEVTTSELPLRKISKDAKKPELEYHAKLLGIEVKGMNRTNLLDAINEAQEEEN